MPIEMRAATSKQPFYIHGEPETYCMVDQTELEVVAPNAQNPLTPTFADTLEVEDFPERRAPDPRVAGTVTFVPESGGGLKTELIYDFKPVEIRGIIFEGKPFGTPVTK